MGKHIWRLFLLVVLLSACEEGDKSPATTDLSANAETANAQTDSTTEAGITATYSNTNRDIWQKPELVLDLLGSLEGKTVADIGAGKGFFAFKLAPRAKKVIAIEIEPFFIQYLEEAKQRALSESLQNRLETRLATPEDPLLEADEVDAIMIVNTLAYIESQIDYLRNLRPTLKDGGRLLLVDFKRKRLPDRIGPKPSERLPLYRVEEMLMEAGYSDFTSYDSVLDYQYVVVARVD